MATALVPPIGIAAGIVALWGTWVNWIDIGLLVGMYVICALGVSAGFHRLFTHRAYKTKKPVRYFLATAGSMAAEGPPIIWVAHHRRHHAMSDKEGDPHSPHLGREAGLRGALKGLWHSHLGWLMDERLTSEPLRYAPDLVRDRQLVWISQRFLPIVALGLAIPALLGGVLHGSLEGVLRGLVWGGLVRMFLLHHATYAVNSIGHFSGRRRFRTDDHSRNVAWLALPSFGEAWHNNHHAIPNTANHGMGRFELDLSALFIKALEKTGLAWDVNWADQEEVRGRQEQLTAPPVPANANGSQRSLVGAGTD